MRAFLGIDPSLAGTAVASIVDGQITTARFSSAPVHGVRDTVRRLNSIEGWVRDQIAGLGPVDLVVGIEGPSYGQARQGGQHARDGLWWRLVTRALAYVDDVIVVTPAQLKKYAVGKGGGASASKDAVILAVARRYPQFTGATNDEADALVIAAMLARLDGHPIETDLPGPCLAALDKLKETNR